MTIATFNPTPPPSPGTVRKPKLRLLSAPFGDGYSQDTPDGINFIRRTMTLKWETLLPAQADAINAFFTSNAALPFWYQPSNEMTPLKWTCQDWSSTVDSSGFYQFTASLEQSFNLLT